MERPLGELGLLRGKADRLRLKGAIKAALASLIPIAVAAHLSNVLGLTKLCRRPHEQRMNQAIAAMPHWTGILHAASTSSVFHMSMP